MKKLVDAIKKMLGMSDKSSSSDSSSQGFTLIELLVVIAVIGVLAAAVLIAIDPIEQFARGRDAGRKQALAQVGRAMLAYSVANTNAVSGAITFPSGAAWLTTLANSGEIKTVPVGWNAPAVSCAAAAGETAGVQAGSNLCIKSNATTGDFVIYGVLESESETTKGTCVPANAVRYYVYASVPGRAGTVCGGTAPASDFNGTMF